MPYSSISQHLVSGVAEPVQTHLVAKYGRTGLKMESQIHSDVHWTPTLQVKTNKFYLLGIEVSDQLYPSIIKIAAHDLLASCDEMPVYISVACPLAEYQADVRQSISKQLRRDGIGLLTVDDLGNVTEQFAPIAVIHHIQEDAFSKRIADLPSPVRVKFSAAYDVYRANSHQGLQDVSQVIEALSLGFAKECQKKNWITSMGRSAADALDALYNSTENILTQQRAAIGGARDYMRNVRNPASHPPKNMAEVAARIQECREGFLNTTRVAGNLCEAIHKCGLKVRLLVP